MWSPRGGGKVGQALGPVLTMLPIVAAHVATAAYASKLLLQRYGMGDLGPLSEAGEIPNVMSKEARHYVRPKGRDPESVPECSVRTLLSSPLGTAISAYESPLPLSLLPGWTKLDVDFGNGMTKDCTAPPQHGALANPGLDLCFRLDPVGDGCITGADMRMIMETVMFGEQEAAEIHATRQHDRLQHADRFTEATSSDDHDVELPPLPRLGNPASDLSTAEEATVAVVEWLAATCARPSDHFEEHAALKSTTITSTRKLMSVIAASTPGVHTRSAQYWKGSGSLDQFVFQILDGRRRQGHRMQINKYLENATSLAKGESEHRAHMLKSQDPRVNPEERWAKDLAARHEATECMDGQSQRNTVNFTC